jgi:hypothetical protein
LSRHGSAERKASPEWEHGAGEKAQMVEVVAAVVRAADAGILYFLLSLEKTLRPRWRMCDAEADMLVEGEGGVRSESDGGEKGLCFIRWDGACGRRNGITGGSGEETGESENEGWDERMNGRRKGEKEGKEKRRKRRKGKWSCCAGDGKTKQKREEEEEESQG